jgi:hypothetical protein
MEPEPILDQAVRQLVVTPAEVVDEPQAAPPVLSIFAARPGAVVSPPPPVPTGLGSGSRLTRRLDTKPSEGSDGCSTSGCRRIPRRLGAEALLGHPSQSER